MRLTKGRSIWGGLFVKMTVVIILGGMAVAVDKPDLWNPSNPLDISPVDYERQVLLWLREVGVEIDGLAVFEFLKAPKLRC